MIKNQRIESIAYEDLAALKSTSHAEDKDLDYKEQLPDLDGRKPDDARKKMLIDVASFANAGGGDILFGVQEGRTGGQPNGIPVALPGVDAPNIDALQRRWQGIIESGLDPKMAPKVHIRAIPIPSAATAVIIMRVPRSYAAPHMVKETGRFHCRQGPENRTLDTAEIRSAFALSETWAAHAKRFREERISRILGDDTPAPLASPARLVVHLVPLAAATPGFAVDLHKLNASNPPPVYSTGSYGPRFNVDGLAVLQYAAGGATGTYTQFFRDGAVECVLAAVTSETYIYPKHIEPHIISALRRYLPRMVDAGCDYPIIVAAALVGMKGLTPPADNWGQNFGSPIPRDVVFLSDLVFEQECTDIPRLVRPMFDALWQTIGFERSPSYGPDGTWAGQAL